MPKLDYLFFIHPVYIGRHLGTPNSSFPVASSGCESQVYSMTHPNSEFLTILTPHSFPIWQRQNHSVFYICRPDRGVVSHMKLTITFAVKPRSYQVYIENFLVLMCCSKNNETLCVTMRFFVIPLKCSQAI